MVAFTLTALVISVLLLIVGANTHPFIAVLGLLGIAMSIFGLPIAWFLDVTDDAWSAPALTVEVAR